MRTTAVWTIPRRAVDLGGAAAVLEAKAVKKINLTVFCYRARLAVIDVDALTKTFTRSNTERTVLDAVSLHVGAGQISCVIGPSGSGKSTLARCINLLERPTAGTVTVDGTDLTALRERS